MKEKIDSPSVIITEVKKLSFQPGDILVVRTDNPTMKPETAMHIRDRCYSAGLPVECKVLVLVNGMTMDRLTEKEWRAIAERRADDDMPIIKGV